jgi:multiple antibiotic resistance protein
MAVLGQFIHQLIGLVTIINPVAGAAIMVSTVGPAASKAEITSIAKKTGLTVLIASIVTVVVGELVFRFFGINTFSIEAIGGVVILKISLDMIQGSSASANHSAEESVEARSKDDISVIPLGIPILFGPGVIATLILFKNASTSIWQLISLATVILISAAIVWLTLRNARALSSRLGVTGVKILTRVMGLVVGAIAVQFIVTGAYHLWTALASGSS